MTTSTSVQEHYGTESLRENVKTALASAGFSEGLINWSDLAPLDQFHVGGIKATLTFAERLHLQPESTVLDLGSGIGGPARALAATYRCRVTGIDLSRPFVDVATMLSERTGLSDRTTFLRADATALPFAGESVDFAWTQHVAMNIPDHAAFYGEIHRVLKPGGRLAIYDPVQAEGGPVRFPVPWARSADTSWLQTADQMRQALTGAGFVLEALNDVSDLAREWLARSVQPATRDANPPLALPVLMADFPTLLANLARNLHENRVRFVQAIARHSESRI